MPLLTTDQLRAVVRTDLDAVDLQEIINDEEAELVRRLGAHGDGTTAVSSTLAGGVGTLFLPRPYVSISGITEDGTAVAATGYTAAPGGILTRARGLWGSTIVVTYIPVDDRARRRRVLIELCRLALEQTAMRSESVAGEYSYQAPDWEAARANLYRRLTYMGM